jgi:hypothetical protein
MIKITLRHLTNGTYPDTPYKVESIQGAITYEAGFRNIIRAGDYLNEDEARHLQCFTNLKVTVRA